MDTDINMLKRKLKAYSKSQIKFNEPHFTNQLLLRQGNREQVIDLLLNPDKLVYTYEKKGKYGDTIYCLHFKITNNRTIKLPVIFSKKTLYIITYIMRYRSWENMAR